MAWMDMSQAAFELGISERTLRNWIRSGKLKARTEENGRKLVEIPDDELEAGVEDAEAFGAADATAETDEGGFAIQKRLEIALLECGRVKGTLASQERIMENLTGNVSELAGKLHRTQAQTWKLIVALLAVAFLGVLVSVLSNSYYHARRADDANHNQELLSLERDRAKQELDKIAKEWQARDDMRANKFNADLLVFQTERAKMETELKQDYERRKEVLKAEFDKRAAEIEARYRTDIDRAEELNKKNNAERDGWNTERDDLRRQVRELTRERDRLADQAERTEADAAALKQLKRDYSDLETELIRYRRKLLEAGIEPEKDKSRSSSTD